MNVWRQFGNGGTLYLSVNTSYFRTRHSDGDDDETRFAQISESTVASSKVETKNGFKGIVHIFFIFGQI